MRSHWVVLFGALCLFGLIAGCGGTSEEVSPTSAAATSCADLANSFVDITSDIIDQIGDRTDADMETPPADLEAAADEWMNASSEIASRVDELCGSGEFDQLLCDRASAIEPKGEAGQRFLQDKFPSCSEAPPDMTTLPTGG